MQLLATYYSFITLFKDQLLYKVLEQVLQGGPAAVQTLL